MTLTPNFFEDLGDILRYHIEATLMFLENYIESVTGQPLSDAMVLASSVFESRNTPLRSIKQPPYSNLQTRPSFSPLWSPHAIAQPDCW
jgi:hypothetical protein